MKAFVVSAVVLLAGCGEVLDPPVTEVRVSPARVDLIAGETARLSAETRVGDVIATDRAVAWTTSDAAVATVAADGTVTAVAPGAPVIVTAGSEGQAATAQVIVTGPVATITLAPSLPPMIVGATAQLTAALRDASGAAVEGRPLTWTSSDPAVATVSPAGLLTAQAPGGPATITVATADAHRATITVTAVPGVITGIADIQAFLERCPDGDPAFATIQQDFQLRENGVLLTAPVACTAPFSTVPSAQFTDELIAYQVLRTAYYLSRGTAGRLPWTTLALYDWMKGAIAGINFKTAPGQLYCCDQIEGRRYFSMSRLDDFNRSQKHDWVGIASSLDFFLHEIRHTDGPGHTTGCPAFPNATDPPGCDATYDVAALGSYGVQYWLHAGWATGFLHIGIGCAAPAAATRYLSSHVAAANDFRTRFVANAPPAVTSAVLYGGPCE